MKNKLSLTLKNLNIDTYKEPIIYMHKNCYICLSEGFEAKTRLHIKLGNKSLIATLNIVSSDILDLNQVSLSKYAWDYLDAKEEDEVAVTHAKHLYSLKFLRSKMYGNELNYKKIKRIIQDISHGYYSDVHIAAFLTSYTERSRMSKNEIIHLTRAMVDVGERLSWNSDIVVDKHCIGGLPGNRTTPIIVAIVAAFGLKIPKTSSRAITSASGTADTMEVLTDVTIDLPNIKKIVSKENGCIVWGGSVSLSPADDIMIRIERALNIDSEGQLVASILSKKIAAGATHILIDVPVGPTAKIRNKKAANILKNYLEDVGESLGVKVKVIISNGTQPIGNGIGPALEARDVINVLKNTLDAPDDLRQQSLVLAGRILEFSSYVKLGEGILIAKEILESGKAWRKFQSICHEQGGLKEIPQAKFKEDYLALKGGTIKSIDNGPVANHTFP